LLVILIGLSTLHGSSAEWLQNPLAFGGQAVPSRLIIVLLLYFGAGFWLLSQAHWLELNARWLLNDVEKDPSIERIWQWGSVLILLATGLIAAFLPIGPTLAISRLVNGLVFGLLFLVNLLFYAFAMPLFLVLSWLSQQPVQEMAPPPPLEPATTAQSLEQMISPAFETLAIISSSAFWTIFVLVAGIALLYFIRERQIRLSKATLRLAGRKILLWLQQLIARLRDSSVQLPTMPRLQTAGSAPSGGFADRLRRFLPLGALTPREQVRRFYLSTVHRAGERGVRRPPAATPLEFERDLHVNWPAAGDDLSELTGAFLEARYGAGEIEPATLEPIRRTWQRVQKELKRQREDKEPDSSE
jgi:hypothetical protein